MPLHPEVQRFIKLVEESGRPRLYKLSAPDARAQAATANFYIGAGPDVAAVEDLVIPVRDGEIPGRLYEPKHAPATIVWLHGGGWVLADLDSHDAMCRILANASGCRVVSVDYRLAPESAFPGPLEDCWDALLWAADRHAAQPLMIGGDSAGGNLAAVCALRARDRGGPDLALEVLIYPVTDHDFETESYVVHGGEDTLLGRREMVWFFGLYVPEGVDRGNPEISPLRAADLSNLPPTIVVTGEYDPLRDEGLAYAARLREAGIDVVDHHYDDMIHGFFSHVNLFQRGNEAVDLVGRDIRTALTTRASA